MKTLEKVKLKQLINFFVFLSFFFSNAQELKTFYTAKESIELKDPVVIGVSGYYNLFITNKENLTKKLDINTLMAEGKIFLYNDSTTFSDFVNIDFKDKIGSCEDISKAYKLSDKYIIFNLPKNVNTFYFGFISLKEYDKKMSNPHEKAYLKVTKIFYPILFPICEN